MRNAEWATNHIGNPQWLRFGMWIILFAITVASQADILASDHPNIVMILIDDMGYSDLGCFGGTMAPTPNIDRLAKEGIQFRSFYVNSPICSPSRTALTTGQYPHRLKITSYLDDAKRNTERGVAQWLDSETPTIADRLKKVGYATGHFGKWHMGGQRNVGDAPLISEYGFDASLTNFEGLGPRVLPLNDAFDGKPPGRHDLGSRLLGHGPVRWATRSAVTSEFVGEAIRFIEQSQKDKKPFYINLWPDDVHSPYFPPKALRDATDQSKRALYYAVLQAMDQQLRVLFEHIQQSDTLRINTLILLASDNGHEESAGQSNPFRGSKTWLYEGGIRSPLIVWGPGMISRDGAGTVNEESVICALDLSRSLTALAGAEIEPNAICDGENLAETLLGKSSQSRGAPIFWRRPPDRPGSNDEDNPDLAVRDGRWKLLINYDRSSPQLYDLEKDASESHNLVNEYPEVGTRLTEAVFAWNAQMPMDAGDPAFHSAAIGRQE